MSSKQRVASNLVLMGTVQIGTWGLSFAYTYITSRYLGATRLGALTYIGSILALLGLVVGLGLDTYITRAVARAPHRGSALASASLVVRAALIVPALVALVVWVNIDKTFTGEMRVAAYISVIGMMLGLLAGVPLATFQAHEKMSYGAAWTLSQNVLSLGLAFVVIAFHQGIVAFAAVGTVLDVILLALNLSLIRLYARLTLRVSRADIVEVLRGGLSFWAKNIVLQVYIVVDSIILGALIDTRAVGFYRPAMLLYSVALFLPGIISVATLPLLSRLGTDLQQDFERVGRKSLELLIAASVPITIGLATFARPLVTLVFGPEFDEAVPVVVTISFCILPTYINVQLAQMLIARDKELLWTGVMIVGGLINIALNYVFIPLAQTRLHNAAIGAAGVLFITETFEALIAMVLMRRVVFHRALAVTALGACAAGAAQLIAWDLTLTMWAPLSQAISVTVYACVGILLGVLPYDDIMLIWNIVSRQVRRLLNPSTPVRPPVPEITPLPREEALAESIVAGEPTLARLVE